jgi:predicted MPP superfamily phosphohydrolase
MPLTARLWRHAPAILLLAAVVWVQFRLCNWVLEWEKLRNSRGARVTLRILAAAAALFVTYGIAGTYVAFVARMHPSMTAQWVRGVALTWAFASLLSFVVVLPFRAVPRFSEKRRGFLRGAGVALGAAPFAALGYGILLERTQLRLREVDVPIPNLPRDLDGLRIVQLSDVHLSAFLTEREFARAIDMANGLSANLAFVTGDLITTYGDPLDACLRQVARLRTDAGTLGCLGNHEIYAQVQNEETWKAARLGIQILRQESRLLRFGSALLNVAGVDYQHRGRRYLVGAETLMTPGATNVLLSHNPDVFDVAARQGWELTVSGHTHGGQITVEILHQNVSFSRFFTPYVYGLYRKGRSSEWVTRGIGTVGIPARFGAPPEVALIRLCAT